jgi:hypothetical protein
MTPTGILYSIYVPLFMLTMVYVAVNAFHLVRFRLPGDLSWLLLTVYLLTVVGVVMGSISSAILAFAV